MIRNHLTVAAELRRLNDSVTYYRNVAFDFAFQKKNDYSSHFAITGPAFTVGTSVSSSRVLGGLIAI